MQKRVAKRIMTAALAAVVSFSPLAGTASQAVAQTRDQARGELLGRLNTQQQEALQKLKLRVNELEVSERAVPEWMTGDLGPAQGRTRGEAAIKAMDRLGPIFRQTENDKFEQTQQEINDELGQTHIRLQQRYRGLRVIGGRMIVHMQKERVIGVNGNFVPEINVDENPALTADAALAIAAQKVESPQIAQHSEPELVVFTTKEQSPRLAWSRQVEFASQDGVPQIEEIFADAETGELLARHPLVKTAKFRKVYDANNTFSLPGTLRWQETSPWWSWFFLDPAEKGAAIGTGQTYDFYHAVFGRDSYNNAGAQLISTVHYGSNLNNAYWSSTNHQMMYGDGDGVKFAPFSLALDVTAHELTHAVTDSTADLVYSGESGALNEAMSDIFAECTEKYINGAPDWLIGEDVYTPGVAGDALRYMYDPVLDDPQISDPDLISSRDYYPDRYLGGKDYGGVHINSGIANLAFYLLTVGGSHPRGKTTNVVPGIGISKAQQIFYRALTVYMDPDDSFLDARSKTIKAAADLYGGSCSAEAKAVKSAWSAVGVRPAILILDPCLIIWPPPIVRFP